MLRRVLTLLVAALAAASFAQTRIVMKAKFGDADGGENVATWNADGTFESHTTLDIAGQHIVSALSGKRAGTKILEYVIEESRNGAGGKLTVKDGKFSAERGGKEQAKGDFPSKANYFMGNLHPQTVRTFLSAYKQGIEGVQKFKVCFLDSAGDVEIGVLRKTARTALHDGKPETISPFACQLGQLDVEFVLDSAGNVIGMNVPTQTLTFIAEGWTELFVDPVAKYKELSQPTFMVKTEKVTMAMRDGIKLIADVYRPLGDGRFPVILSRTPYGRGGDKGHAEWFARRGYVFVAQDTRGREDSEGVFVPFENERKDGYDTVNWVSKQPWSTGSVGMIGASYGGLVQWAAAVEHHPALKCIIPQVSPPDAFYNIPYDHGVPMLWSNIWWLQIVKDKKTNMGSATTPMKNPKAFTTLPLSKVDDEVTGANLPMWDSWMKRETPNQYGDFNFESLIPSVKIPALHISGWFDGDGIGTKLNYAAARSGGNTNQWLIYGPWSHFFNTTSRMADVDFGAQAILELDSLYLRWFDTWLKGKNVNLKATPKVQVFVTGANEWRALSDWPDAKSTTATYYLGAKGAVQGLASTGTLSPVPSNSKPTGYTYDPSQAKVPDALTNLSAATVPSLKVPKTDFKEGATFQTEPFKADTTIGGPVQLDLHFSTSAKDTDFFASVVDVYPNGDMVAIGIGGKIRARYLSGWNTPKALQPGKVYRAKIDLWDIAHCFKKGHRIGLAVTSTAFPIYARNLGTGEPNATGTRMVAQNQLIYMDPKHPSALRFQVLPKKG